MAINKYLSLLIILLIFSKIKNESYDFNSFSDLKCDKTNEIQSFQAHICGKTKLHSSLYFSFIVQDTNLKSHSIKCSIQIPTSLRNLKSAKISTIKEDVELDSDEISQENDTEIEIGEQTNRETFTDNKTNESFYDDNYTDFLENNTNYTSDKADSKDNYILSDTTYENIYESTNLIGDEISDRVSTNIEDNEIEPLTEKTNILLSDIKTDNTTDANESTNDTTEATIEKNERDTDTNKDTTIDSTPSIDIDTDKDTDKTIRSTPSTDIDKDTTIDSTPSVDTDKDKTIDSTPSIETDIDATIHSIPSRHTDTDIDKDTISTTQIETTIPSFNSKTTPPSDIEVTIASDEYEVDSTYSIKTTTINEQKELKTEILRTLIPEIQAKTTVPETKIESTIPNIETETTIPSNDKNDKSTIINIETIQIQKDNDIGSIEINEEVNYVIPCYQTICEFEEKIKEDFEIKIEPNVYIINTNSQEIEMKVTIKEQQSFNIKKCCKIKNIFKQVLKYRTIDSEKKISFLFIAKILSKIEKNEKIIASVELKKKENTLRNLENEKNSATCYSRYEAEPVEGEEVLASYNCEVSNLEKPSQYSGLLFTSSPDVDEIIENKDLQDPAITDELIKNNLIQDHSVPTFISENIDISECENNGKFYINGKLNGKIDETLYLVLYLQLNGNILENASCTVPKASWTKIIVSCEVKNNFKNSKITILPHKIINYNTNETVITITSVAIDEEVTCNIEPEPTEFIHTDIMTHTPTPPIPPPTVPETMIIPDTTIIQVFIDTEIIFRQISHLEIDSSSNKIKFNLFGFTVNSLQKNSYLMVIINLIKSKAENEERNATCFLDNAIDADKNYLNPLSLDCELNDVDDIKQVNDIQIISSPLIKNIPNDNSNLTILTYAKMTDELIEKGELTDYSKENNNIPPVLSNSIINADSCFYDGTFIIKGLIDTKIEKNMYFYIDLDNPEEKVRCQIPSTEANTLIDINCGTMNKFDNSKIEIDSKIVYDIKYNELLYINRTVTNDKTDCISNRELKLSAALKKLNAIFSFRQVSKFKKVDNKYKFFLATFIKDNIDENMKLNIQVEIKREINEKNFNLINKRKLSEKETKNVECTPSMITDINEDGLGAAGWECSTEESSIDDAIGLDILDSEDMSGIPNNSALIDPAQTDLLIQNGVVKDYSIEENLNELLPIFNILSLNFSFCKQNGTFNFEGDLSSTTFKDVVFNLSLAYPEAIFACKLPRTLKGEKAVIECFNRDNFENDPILVEETVIRDGLNEFVILRNSSSGVNYVTCSSSESTIKEQKYENDYNKIIKTIKDEKSGGIGIGGIIVISVVGGLVLVGITILIILFTRKSQRKNTINTDRNVVNSTISSVGTNSSPSYY